MKILIPFIPTMGLAIIIAPCAIKTGHGWELLRALLFTVAFSITIFAIVVIAMALWATIFYQEDQ